MAGSDLGPHIPYRLLDVGAFEEVKAIEPKSRALDQHGPPRFVPIDIHNLHLGLIKVDALTQDLIGLIT